jgi:hypothetical protein
VVLFSYGCERIVKKLALTPALSPKEREHRLAFFFYFTHPLFMPRW